MNFSQPLKPPIPTKALPATKDIYLLLAAELEGSLQKNILHKFFPAAIDSKGGGFFQKFNHDWTLAQDEGPMPHLRPTSTGSVMWSFGRKDAKVVRSVVYQSRMTWLAAQAAMRYPAFSAKYLHCCKHGAQFLMRNQWDHIYGGFWWEIDTAGQPLLAGRKHLYGDSFAIYALAACYKASADHDVLLAAKKCFARMEMHAHDHLNGGYFEQQRADGSPLQASDPEFGRRGTDLLGARPGQKTMNTHLHLLESFTALLEVWKDDSLRMRTEELYELVLTKITTETGRLHQFFTLDWKPVEDDRDSYGHAIESVELLVVAAACLGKPDDPQCWLRGQRIVDYCLSRGYDVGSGGLNHEGISREVGTVDRKKIWWVQAESLNTLLLMHERFGANEAQYWDAFVRQWHFIRSYQIDQKFGGWHKTVTENLTPAPGPKTDAWTEGYHQGRAMLQVTKRLQKLAAL